MANPEQAFRHSKRVLKYLKGELNQKEKTLFEDWLQEDNQNIEFIETLRTPEYIKKELEFFASVDSFASWDTVKAAHLAERPFYRQKFWQYAAAIFFCMACSLVWYSLNMQPSQRILARQDSKAPERDIEPGGDKAKLTLADGTVILLEEAKNGTIGTHSGVRISKEGGMLIYEVLSMPGGDTKLSYNTISTPRGGQYKVLLPDGSKVWLNSSSVLNYPTTFSGSERQVKLSGEAYFEISKNKDMPFKVLANGAEVEVLGTHFNVMAYPDESSMNTTLLEGSVKISKGTASRTLVPGQQASLSKSNSMAVRAADLEEAIAWKDGVFLFNNEDIQMVMRELGRWYDADISYLGNEIPDRHFTGKISRNNNISKVLNMLELTGGVHFRVNDKKVEVY